jgi:hypothetical protein
MNAFQNITYAKASFDAILNVSNPISFLMVGKYLQKVRYCKKLLLENAMKN